MEGAVLEGGEEGIELGEGGAAFGTQGVGLIQMGQQFGYAFDAIGNRTKAKANDQQIGLTSLIAGLPRHGRHGRHGHWT